MAAAIVLTQVNSKIRTLFYSVAIMPVLFVGIGIQQSFLDRIASMTGGAMAEIGRNGVFLTILAQTCYFNLLLIFVARLQRLDKTQEGAAVWALARRRCLSKF